MDIWSNKAGTCLQSNARSMMQCPWRVPALLGIIVLLCIAITAERSTAGDVDIAWCWDGNHWIAYAEGVPGSASRERLTECLSGAAERGEGFAIKGQLVEEGALFDLGQSTLIWQYDLFESSFLQINAYDKHMTLTAGCSPVYEIYLEAIDISYGVPRCFSPVPLLETDQQITEPDFVIYSLNRDVVIDGDQGWYHAGHDDTGADRDQTPRTELFLTTKGRSIWNVMGRYMSRLNQIAVGPGPIAGADGQGQTDGAQRWIESVSKRLLPDYVSDIETALLPDWEAYWYQTNQLLELIANDLFGERAQEFRSFVNAEGTDAIIPEYDRIVLADRTDTFASVLVKYVLAITDSENPYGPEFTATMIAIWHRYFPFFDTEEAQRSAHAHYILVGDPISLEPPSERTRSLQRRLLANLPSHPSDNMGVPPKQLIGTVTIELVRPYEPPNLVELTSTVDLLDAHCWVRESGTTGAGSQLRLYSIEGTLTSARYGNWTWNGVYAQQNYLYDASGGIVGSEILLRGTPSQVGRVLLEVTTRCPGGLIQEPRLLGFVEIIVEDPDSEDE